MAAPCLHAAIMEITTTQSHPIGKRVTIGAIRKTGESMTSTTGRNLNRELLRSQRDQFLQRFAQIKTLGLALDITRGKPSVDQLDLSNDLLTLPGNHYMDQNIDTRNYGGDGPQALKEMFAEMLDVPAANVIMGGNSSLNLMFDILVRACLFGVPDGDGPWSTIPNRKFLCPVPGYDRHFSVTEHLGFDLLSVPMTDAGPNMDQVEEMVAADPDIKGIWCVPRFSNPTGCCYTEEVIRRLAYMPAARDFRILWDNAYAEHHLGTPPPPLANIFTLCNQAGHPNRVIEFASTSKITHPGSGVSAMAASDENIADARCHLDVQTIGPDKVNQMRHLRFFGDIQGLREHMGKHAEVIRPRFEAVDRVLTKELEGLGIAEWTQPGGGYFISLDVPDGTAARVIALAAEAGVELTAAGAPFPYGKDPNDRQIRIAPTFPTEEEVGLATEVLALCVKLAASE